MKENISDSPSLQLINKYTEFSSGEQEGNFFEWLHSWSELEKQISEQKARLTRRIMENVKDNQAVSESEWFTTRLAELSPVRREMLTFALGNPDLPPNLLSKFKTQLLNESGAEMSAQIEIATEQYRRHLNELILALDEKVFDGKSVRALMSDDNEVTRKAAYLELHMVYKRDASQLGESFLEIVSRQKTFAKEQGFDRFVDYRWVQLNRGGYSPEGCTKFHKIIIEEIVPTLQEIRSGYEQDSNFKIAPWNLWWRQDQVIDRKIFNSEAEQLDAAEKILQALDSEFAFLFKTLRQEDWLDIWERPNKAQSYSFCEDFHKSNRAYVFHYGKGSQEDQTYLFHEIGHALHSMMSMEAQPLIWNRDPGSEFSEFAAQALEVLTLPFLGKEKGGYLSNGEINRALRAQLMRCLEVFVVVGADDAFQHRLYELDDLNTETVSQLYSDILRSFYPHVNWNSIGHLSKYGWLNKPHLLQDPFYMLSYAISMLGVIQLMKLSLEDSKTSSQNFKNALKLGSTLELDDLFETAGVRLRLDRITVREAIAFIQGQLSTLG